jgi:LysR family nitrogen assimilation transcriptional regulator
MEFNQLKHFISVAQHGSFSKAAAATGVAQPFLSRQIRRLEVELHKHLFYRHGRGISLTDDGQSFLLTATSVIGQLELAAQVTHAADGELTGRFCLGMTPSLARNLTVPLVRAFTARFPKAQLAVVEDLTRNLHDRLINGRVDAAMLHDQTSSPLINIQTLSEEVLCLITRRSNFDGDQKTIDFAKLAGIPMIFPSAPHPLRSIVEAQAAKSSVPIEVRYDIDGVETILELAQEGFGSTVAAAHVVNAGHWANSLVAIPIVNPAIKTTISLATLARQPATALLGLTQGLVREVFKHALTRA